jgi:hypothetical protein
MKKFPEIKNLYDPINWIYFIIFIFYFPRAFMFWYEKYGITQDDYLRTFLEYDKILSYYDDKY